MFSIIYIACISTLPANRNLLLKQKYFHHKNCVPIDALTMVPYKTRTTGRAVGEVRWVRQGAMGCDERP